MADFEPIFAEPEDPFAQLKKQCTERLSYYIGTERKSSKRVEITGAFSDKYYVKKTTEKNLTVDELTALINNWNNQSLDAIEQLLIQLSNIAEAAQKDVTFSLLVKSGIANAIDDVKINIWNYLSQHKPDINRQLIQTHQNWLNEAKKPENIRLAAVDRSGKYKNRAEEFEHKAEQIYKTDKARESLYRSHLIDIDNQTKVAAPADPLALLKRNCNIRLDEYLGKDRSKSWRVGITSIFSHKSDLKQALAKQNTVDELKALIYNFNDITLESVQRLLINLSNIADKAQSEVTFSIFVKSGLAKAVDDVREKIWEYLTRNFPIINQQLIQQHQRMLDESKLPANKTTNPENGMDGKYKTRAEELEHIAEQIYTSKKAREAIDATIQAKHGPK